MIRSIGVYSGITFFLSKGVYSLKKVFALRGGKFFQLRVDPMLKHFEIRRNDYYNPVALRTAKTLWSYGRSECNRVKIMLNPRKMNMYIYTLYTISTCMPLYKVQPLVSAYRSEYAFLAYTVS